MLRMAREAIIEHRAGLECFWRARVEPGCHPGQITRGVWAAGLRAVGGYALETFADGDGHYLPVWCPSDSCIVPKLDVVFVQSAQG